MQSGDKKETGITLIEVLIALLVISIGLLGMAGLQLRAMTLNQSAYHRLQAVNLAADISDRIYVNALQADLDLYTVSLNDTQNAAAVSNANEVAELDMLSWQASLGKLPDGLLSIENGVVTTSPIKTYQITICWLDKAQTAAQVPECGNRGFQSFIQLKAVSRTRV